MKQKRKDTINIIPYYKLNTRVNQIKPMNKSIQNYEKQTE